MNKTMNDSHVQEWQLKLAPLGFVTDDHLRCHASSLSEDGVGYIRVYAVITKHLPESEELVYFSIHYKVTGDTPVGTNADTEEQMFEKVFRFMDRFRRQEKANEQI